MAHCESVLVSIASSVSEIAVAIASNSALLLECSCSLNGNRQIIIDLELNTTASPGRGTACSAYIPAIEQRCAVSEKEAAKQFRDEQRKSQNLAGSPSMRLLEGVARTSCAVPSLTDTRFPISYLVLLLLLDTHTSRGNVAFYAVTVFTLIIGTHTCLHRALPSSGATGS